ncbi:Hypothetical protein, putative [Bodo saltans]|uniref:Uncharacterized protein n=1 Tax=Bodo saltans TaxID=75058 RepID=A0A0S4JQE3_BODSA|nr:Hypothetical protein, putative [Bodo saltans]|eukprot:CUG92422.1 Hypothetical protein, putative [Bodo saltans]
MPGSPSRSVQSPDEYIAQRIERHDKNIARLEEEIKHYDQEASNSTRVAAASPHPTDASSTIGAIVKKLEPDELQAVVDRLSRPVNRDDDELPPIPGRKEPRVLAADEVDELVDRLGVRDINTRTEKHEERLAAAEDSLPLKKILEAKGEDALVRLDNDQQQSLGERLCNQALEKRKETIKRLGDAAYNSTMKFSAPISKGRVKECAARLCDGSLSKKESEMSKLRDKYMGPLTQSRKLTLEEQKACGDRLTTKK